MAQAVSGAASPYLATEIHRLTEDNPEAQAMAHAVVGAVASYASGHNALAGAAGAVSGELMAKLVMNQLYPGKAVSDLAETEKQTISALGTLAAGLAGGVVGDSAANVVAGAQAGKNAADFNAMSLPGGLMSYGQAVASWKQYAQDNNLTREQAKEGLKKIATGEGPSWGVEYKVKPYVKVEIAGGTGAGYYFDTSIDPYQISANHGETLAVGGRISGQAGIQFGPYFSGAIDSTKSSYLGLGFGIISGEISYGKDGVGFSFGVGPAWGWSGISTNIAGEKVDFNGSSGTEFYHYDFNQEKAK